MDFFKRITKPKVKLFLEVYDRELSLGESIKGKVKVKTEENFSLKEILIILNCIESIKKTTQYTEENSSRNSKKDLIEEDYWDYSTIYSDQQKVCGQTEVDFGLEKDFPFLIKIPSNENPTYNSKNRNVEWFLNAKLDPINRIPVEDRKIVISVNSAPKIQKEVV